MLLNMRERDFKREKERKKIILEDFEDIEEYFVGR